MTEAETRRRAYLFTFWLADVSLFVDALEDKSLQDARG